MKSIVPEISVIIPVHNGEKYLAEAIQSVLNQNYAAIEILVIDNASTDATAQIISKFPSVHYFYLEKKGLVNALNLGVQQSRGALLSFVDADDLWKTGKLAAQLDAFASNPAVDAVFTHIEQFISPELESPVKERLRIRLRELPGYVRGTMLIRKESFLRVGLFDDSSDFGEFIDWYMRAQEQDLQTVMLPEVLCMRRIHGTNLGFIEQQSRIEYARVLKRGLDRRRRLSRT